MASPAIARASSDIICQSAGTPTPALLSTAQGSTPTSVSEQCTWCNATCTLPDNPFAVDGPTCCSSRCFQHHRRALFKDFQKFGNTEVSLESVPAATKPTISNDFPTNSMKSKVAMPSTNILGVRPLSKLHRRYRRPKVNEMDRQKCDKNVLLNLNKRINKSSKKVRLRRLPSRSFFNLNKEDGEGSNDFETIKLCPVYVPLPIPVPIFKSAPEVLKILSIFDYHSKLSCPKISNLSKDNTFIQPSTAPPPPNECDPEILDLSATRHDFSRKDNSNEFLSSEPLFTQNNCECPDSRHPLVGRYFRMLDVKSSEVSIVRLWSL